MSNDNKDLADKLDSILSGGTKNDDNKDLANKFDSILASSDDSLISMLNEGEALIGYEFFNKKDENNDIKSSKDEK